MLIMFKNKQCLMFKNKRCLIKLKFIAFGKNYFEKLLCVYHQKMFYTLTLYIASHNKYTIWKILTLARVLNSEKHKHSVLVQAKFAFK